MRWMKMEGGKEEDQRSQQLRVDSHEAQHMPLEAPYYIEQY